MTLYNPQGTGVGDVSQSVIVHHIAAQARKLVSYEPIIPMNYGLSGLRDLLVTHPGVQARIDHLGARLAEVV